MCSCRKVETARGADRVGGLDQARGGGAPPRILSCSPRVARVAVQRTFAVALHSVAAPGSCKRGSPMTHPGRTHPSTADEPFHLNVLWRSYDAVATGVDHRLGWTRLPKLVGLFDLVGIRNVLREHNLVDTSRQPSVNAVLAPPWDPTYENQRTVDGSWNDLANPTMGMAGTRFGRNVPIEDSWPDTEHLLEPNPRTVSRQLMTREELLPATAGNALIASWLQFMIREWLNHGRSPVDNPWSLELEPDDDWPAPPLLVFRTAADQTTPSVSDLPPTYLNVTTHWWDGSQIYGNSAAEQGFL